MTFDRYAAYARETAMCVDFAYDAFQEDLERELGFARGDAREALQRLLDGVKARRRVLDQFLAERNSKAA